VSSRTALAVCAKLDDSALHENGPFPKLDVYLFGSRLSSKKSDNHGSKRRVKVLTETTRLLSESDKISGRTPTRNCIIFACLIFASHESSSVTFSTSLFAFYQYHRTVLSILPFRPESSITGGSKYFSGVGNDGDL